MAFEWLGGRSKEKPLEDTINQIGEPIVAKTLGQVAQPGRTRQEWSLLLLTDTSLVIIHSEPRSWVAQLTSAASGEDSVRKIPLESIASIIVPPRRSWFGRLVHGPTLTVTVEFHDGSESIQIGTDDRSTEFYTIAARMTEGNR